MSDAQSILLILLIFYAIECLKWAPLGSVALCSVGVFRSKWKMQQPTVNFFGARKSLLIAPVFPACQLQLITDKVGDGGHRHSEVKSVVGVQRRLFRLRGRTLMLRTISAYTFATYFVFLPALYLKFGLGSYVYSTVGIGYLLQAICAVSYFLVHRRFFPKERGVRALHTFYNLLLPWHAMRAADEFFIKSSMNWSELAILGATTTEGTVNERLGLYWRQSQWLEQSSYSAKTLLPIFEQIGMSTETALQMTRPQDAGQTYCPCCGVIYRADVAQCADCPELVLRKS